ncbi:MAG: metallophosphoesterase [Polyangiaceae bacterium]
MSRWREAARGAARALVAAGVVGLALGASSSCVNVARRRAEADLDVGRASADALDVEMVDGLACVRAIGPGALTLRAQAPTVRGRVTVKGGAPTLTVTVDNVHADARFVARAPDGALLPSAGEPPTRRKQIVRRVTVPAAGVVELDVSAPTAADSGPFDVGVLADVQEAIATVGEVYARINEHPSLEFVLFTGDLTRQGRREQLEEFERREQELDVPLYATLGNHELGAERVYFQEMYGRGSYSFVHRGVRFTMLDSASATLDPLVYGWLDGWLEQGRDATHVVAMHIAPFDPVGLRNGSFASRAEAAMLVSRLARGRVDVTLYGHVHSFYAFANGGIPAYISGGGGAIPERMDGIGRNFLVMSLEAAGPTARRPEVTMVRVGDGP